MARIEPLAFCIASGLFPPRWLRLSFSHLCDQEMACSFKSTILTRKLSTRPLYYHAAGSNHSMLGSAGLAELSAPRLAKQLPDCGNSVETDAVL